MKVYGYTSVNGKHWLPADDYVSLGQCGGRHYFAIPDNAAIPEQPEEIGFDAVIDAAELRQVAGNAPYFFRWRGTPELIAEAAKVGIELE